MEAGADCLRHAFSERFFWYDDDGLLEILIFQFVQGDEH
jgi:hypothetical protein